MREPRLHTLVSAEGEYSVPIMGLPCRAHPWYSGDKSDALFDGDIGERVTSAVWNTVAIPRARCKQAKLPHLPRS